MKSWGDLPPRKITTWKKHQCDAVFTAERMQKKSIVNCTSIQSLSMASSLPLITIMAASSTRKMPSAQIHTMSLFNFLLPSVVRTLDCGFRYAIVVGYDVGDAFYEHPLVRHQCM